MDHDGPNDNPKIPVNSQILVFYEKNCGFLIEKQF